MVLRRPGGRGLALLGHRIESALIERIATQQAPQCERGAAARSVERDRLGRVIGTRRMKTASAAEKRRKKSDVDANQQEQRPRCGRFAAPVFDAAGARRIHGLWARGISCSNSRDNAEKAAVAAELRG